MLNDTDKIKRNISINTENNRNEIQQIDRNLTKIEKNISLYNDTAISKFQKIDQHLMEIQRNISRQLGECILF